MTKKFTGKGFLYLALTACVLVLVTAGHFTAFEGLNIETAAMVKSVGADIDDKCHLTFVQNSVGESPQTVQTALTAFGGNFTDAMNNLQLASDKELTTGYVRNYLIGTDTASKSMKSTMDFFGRSKTVQLSANVYLAQDTAEEFLKSAARAKEEADGMLTDLQVTGERDGYYMPVTFSEALSYMNGKNGGVLPVVKIVKVDSTDEKMAQNAKFVGYGIVSGGRVVDYLDENASRGYNFAVGKLKRTTLTVGYNGDYAFDVDKTRSRVSFYVEDSKLKRINISVRFTSSFSQAADNVNFSEKMLNILEMKQEQTVKDEISAAVEKLRLTGVDFMRLEDKFAAIHPYWARENDNFSEILKDIEISVDTSCKIVGTYDLEKV